MGSEVWQRRGGWLAARWLRLSYNLDDKDAKGILVKAGGGKRLALGAEVAPEDMGAEPAVIDLALGVARAGRSIQAVSDVLASSSGGDNERLWAAMGELVRLVGESDHDGEMWAWAIRNRTHIEG